MIARPVAKESSASAPAPAARSEGSACAEQALELGGERMQRVAARRHCPHSAARGPTHSGIVRLHIGHHPLPEAGQIGDEIEHLPHQRRHDQQGQAGDREQEQAVQQDHRREAAQPQAALQQVDRRAQNQGEDAGDRQGPQHAGKAAHHPRQRPEDERQQGAGREQREKRGRKADELALAVGRGGGCPGPWRTDDSGGRRDASGNCGAAPQVSSSCRPRPRRMRTSGRSASSSSNSSTPKSATTKSP